MLLSKYCDRRWKISRLHATHYHRITKMAQVYCSKGHTRSGERSERRRQADEIRKLHRRSSVRSPRRSSVQTRQVFERKRVREIRCAPAGTVRFSDIIQSQL
jgi:hypothetical protein